MALIADNSTKSSGPRVEQPTLPIGVYPARLVQIIDMGVQAQRPYQGVDKPPAQEISLTYELVDTFMIDKDGKEDESKPRWISETFPLRPLSQDKAKSTQRYNALDPSSEFKGDFSKCIETPVNVTIIHGGVNAKTGKPYENVGSISAMRARDADKCPPLVNDVKVFDFDAPDIETFNKFPEWIQTKIKGALNYNGSKLSKLLSGDVAIAPSPSAVDEDIPAVASKDSPW